MILSDPLASKNKHCENVALVGVCASGVGFIVSWVLSLPSRAEQGAMLIARKIEQLCVFDRLNVQDIGNLWPLLTDEKINISAFLRFCKERGKKSFTSVATNINISIGKNKLGRHEDDPIIREFQALGFPKFAFKEVNDIVAGSQFRQTCFQISLLTFALFSVAYVLLKLSEKKKTHRG